MAQPKNGESPIVAFVQGGLSWSPRCRCSDWRIPGRSRDFQKQMTDDNSWFRMSAAADPATGWPGTASGAGPSPICFARDSVNVFHRQLGWQNLGDRCPGHPALPFSADHCRAGHRHHLAFSPGRLARVGFAAAPDGRGCLVVQTAIRGSHDPLMKHTNFKSSATREKAKI